MQSFLSLRYRVKRMGSAVPLLPSAFRRCRSFVYSIRRRRRGDVSSEIYRSTRWRYRESRSGSGSNLAETEAVRRELPAVFTSLGTSTLLDAPCGDFNWMGEADLDAIVYFGVDIVPELIDEDRVRFGNAQRHCEVGDVVTGALPATDVIRCRKCLVHLSFEEAISALSNFRATGAEYLLTTTFPKTRSNYDKSLGLWRLANLTFSR